MIVVIPVTRPRWMRLPILAVGAAMLFLSIMHSSSNEGMWLYNEPPVKRLKDLHGFDADARWLEHIQKSSVRFNSGGSGSFVSEDGLIISNHHVGSDDLQKLSDPIHNLLRDGFHARTRAEEKRCLDLELNVLMSIEDVTARVNAAVKPGMASEAAFLARRSITASIEKESLEKTGLRSDVVPLHQGGAYHLYRYKRYTDVRLVFAPEQQIAFFGGDPDNFEYPRFNLDICLFRAYENGKPARVEHYLKWSTTGVRDGDLVFVSGHPGRTYRQLTMDELGYLRDWNFPYLLSRLYRQEVVLTAWSARSDENARRARDLLYGIQNSRKARVGMQAGLLDPELMEGKRDAEKRLRAAVAADPGLALPETVGAWDAIAAAQKIIASNALAYLQLEGGHGFDSTLFGIARRLVRAADEKGKPNGGRLPEYRDSNRESLELELFSEEPIHDDLETLRLTESLSSLAENLGSPNPIVQKVLAGKSPRARAGELITGTKLKDVALRKKLYAASPAEVEAAGDPMIELARLVDAESRRLRHLVEEQEEVKRQAHAKIAAARFKVEHGSTYPDATFTLRLAYGIVSGYEEDGHKIPFQTTYAGLYERAAEHHEVPPFDLHPRWMERKSRLDLATPFNFVCTADIIGGNSGSPVVNRAGEFVGIIFDGNIQSLVLDFVYTEKQARAVSVNCQSILEALNKVYDAPEVAAELVSGRLAGEVEKR